MFAVVKNTLGGKIKQKKREQCYATAKSHSLLFNTVGSSGPTQIQKDKVDLENAQRAN